ncbi:MAG: hypothetical protein JWM27_1194 [Gemmatimonadetes bacterium]|nr:hypothetical protein [Gemmatimonadota bacterium]
MGEGTIKKLFVEKGFGFIARGVGEPDVFFHRSACASGEFERWGPKDTLEFEVVAGPRGPKALRVRRTAVAADLPRRFVNPYNFVRWLPEPTAGGAAATPLLGRCASPPQDRYTGLTGRILCRLAVASPTFVSDAYAVGVATVARGKEHRSYRQYRTPAGSPAIPGSTLRGVVRSVFEAVTNSCFAGIAADARHGGSASVGDLVPAHLGVCTSALRLCPACRAFGWVSEGPVPGHDAAVRGRVRFGDAVFGKEAVEKDQGPLTLAALSAPHPKYAWFYLMDADGNAPAGRSLEQAGYVRKNRIRGRKVYRRHEPDLQAMRGQSHTEQNRTLLDWLKRGAETRFEVRFESLAPLELGALLWALEPDGGCVHRLGYAKPLGFGCVAIEVTGLHLVTADRYDADASGGDWQSFGQHAPELAALRARFRAGMEERHASGSPPEEATPFATLANVRDLLALLSGTPPATPVCYPRLPGERGFEWFKRNADGARLTLPFADADEPALRL